MSDVLVEIGEVVVTGVQTVSNQGTGVGRAVEASLARLLQRDGLPRELGNRVGIVLSPISVPPGAGDQGLAAQVAVALSRALARPGR